MNIPSIRPTPLIVIFAVVALHGAASADSLASARPERPQEMSERDRQALPPVPPDWAQVKRFTFERFPEANQEETLKFIAHYFPHDMQRVKQMAQIRPNESVETLTELAYRGLGLMRKREQAPERFKLWERQCRLEQQAEALAGTLAGEGDADGDADGDGQRENLEELLEQSFEIKQAIMKMELDELARGLEELRELVDRREKNKQAIIQRRVVELTGEEDDLQW